MQFLCTKNSRGLAAVQLSVSGTTALGAALVAMAGWHALIGIGESVITVAALSFIAASRADLLELRNLRPGRPGATLSGELP